MIYTDRATPKNGHAVLTIAGSDPSGGAGIQADIKTFTVLGVYSCAAVTCLTAQNTLGVDSFLPIDPAFVQKQISLVLQDIAVTHIKTGMIGNIKIAEAVHSVLNGFGGEIICDPIIKASDGHDLMSPDDINAFNLYIATIASVLTPNLPELSLLTGVPIENPSDIDSAADAAFQMFSKLNVIVAKGGHGPHEDDMISDNFYQRDHATNSIKKEMISHPYIDSPNTHGTGCSFASAFTAYHFMTGNYSLAFHHSIHFMDALMTLSAEKRIGHGKGPLFHHLALGK